MKYFLLIPILLFTGCESNPPSDTYKQFKKDHNNSSTFYYCDKSTGFLMEQQVYNNLNSIFTYIKENDLDQPIRCGQANIQVLEISAGSSR